ncbi:protein DpdG [Verrucosispora sp. ts21]|uniref:protein DpdG n=1 Tax=Verrucosispora sp. ts21 TaxID=2069341 RepID=UPI0011AF6A07|nr:protein DpdG [Verrucosispora sp. ts21]
MDYLKRHMLASVPALLVISRYLATQLRDVEENDLQKALRPEAVAERRGVSSAGDEASNVLTSSLSVGEDLGLFECERSGRGRRVWKLRDSIRMEVEKLPSADSRIFRSLVLRLLSSRALEEVRAGNRPSDVALALTWLLQRDPLEPFSSSWDKGPESAFDKAGMRNAVENGEQWGAFRRWARSLGVATVAQVGRQESYLLVDPTRALLDVLDKLPQQAGAEQWFRQLHEILPVLGHPAIISALPQGSARPYGISASVALAAQKLKRRGMLDLALSADASAAAVLQIGGQSWRIGQVNVAEVVE